MSPLSENPRPILFSFRRDPEPEIVIVDAREDLENFKECLRTLQRKLEEYAKQRPEMEKLPYSDPRRILFDCKTAIVCELWSKGKIGLRRFGQDPARTARFSAAAVQDAFTEIINELEVDL